MFNFSIEAFAKECKSHMSDKQKCEQANRDLFETYCNYLQQQLTVTK